MSPSVPKRAWVSEWARVPKVMHNTPSFDTFVLYIYRWNLQNQSFSAVIYIWNIGIISTAGLLICSTLKQAIFSSDLTLLMRGVLAKWWLLLNACIYWFETSWLFLNIKNQKFEKNWIINFVPQPPNPRRGVVKNWIFLKLVLELRLQNMIFTTHKKRN